MKRALPILAAVVLVVATGLLHGWWTERWQRSQDLDAAVARLANVPGDLGDWKSEPVEVDLESLRLAGAEGYWIRKYTNSRTRQSATVMLLCGPSRRMSVHQPEYCYRGSGYELQGTAVRVGVRPTPDEPPVEFLTGRFRKEEATQRRDLRIYWTWFAGDSWQAPTGDARAAFFRYPVLDKLYIVHDATDAPRADKDPYLDFIRLLMPPLTRALTPEPPPS